MGWDTRSGNYYRRHREGNKTIRESYEKGDAARLAAAIDAHKCRKEPKDPAVAALERVWTEACEPLIRLRHGTRSIVQALRVAAGQPGGLGGNSLMNTEDDAVVNELLDVLHNPGADEQSAWPRVQRLLKDRPEIVDHFGDIAKVAAENWLSLYARTSMLMKETTRLKMEAWKATLAGPHPSPLEVLLIEEAMVCWLQTHYFAVMYAQALQARASEAIVDEICRRQDASRKSLAETLCHLAELRRMLAISDPANGDEKPPPG
jgi:hypothetical protein